MPRKKPVKSPRSPLVSEPDVDTKPVTRCPISHKDFIAAAENVPVTIGKGHTVVAIPREFSTGSLGWIHSSKGGIMVGEVMVPVQITVNLTVINSKAKAV